MSNSPQRSPGFNSNNNDEIDQKKSSTNRPAIEEINVSDDEIKLTIKDDNQTQQLDQQQRQVIRANSLTIRQPLINNSQTNSLMHSNTLGALCDSLAADSLMNSATINDSTLQNLPPSYWQIPGTVPAGSSSGPPPTYEDVINPNAAPPSYHSLFGQVRAARKNAKTLPDLIRKLIIILLGTIGLAILISFTVLIPFTMILVGGSNLDNCPAERIPLFLLIGGITWLSKNLSSFFTQCSTRRTARSANNAPSNTANNSSSSNPCASRFSANTYTAESNACASSSSNSTNNCNSTNRSSRCVINLENEQVDLQQTRNRRREFLINCFITAWFLTGCIMVYRIYPPNYTDPLAPNYCNKTVYICAFWLLTSTFIIFALFIGCICCISMTAVFQSEAAEIRI